MAYVSNVAVAPECRRQGVAALLLQQAEQVWHRCDYLTTTPCDCHCAYWCLPCAVVAPGPAQFNGGMLRFDIPAAMCSLTTSWRRVCHLRHRFVS